MKANCEEYTYNIEQSTADNILYLLFVFASFTNLFELRPWHATKAVGQEYNQIHSARVILVSSIELLFYAAK